MASFSSKSILLDCEKALSCSLPSLMNRLIELDMPVTYEFVDRDHIPAEVKLDRLPDDASETLRLVRNIQKARLSIRVY